MMLDCGLTPGVKPAQRGETGPLHKHANVGKGGRKLEDEKAE